jgi:hypothetical protein
MAAGADHSPECSGYLLFDERSLDLFFLKSSVLLRVSFLQMLELSLSETQNPQKNITNEILKFCLETHSTPSELFLIYSIYFSHGLHPRLFIFKSYGLFCCTKYFVGH